MADKADKTAKKEAKKAAKEAKAAQKKKEKEEKAAQKAKAKEEKAKAKAAKAEEKKKAKESKGKADKGGKDKAKAAKAEEKKKAKEAKAEAKRKAKEEKAKAKAAKAEEKKKAKESKGKADKAEAKKEKDAPEDAEGKKKGGGIPKVALLAIPGVLTVLAVAVFVFRIRPMMEARRALEPPPGQPPVEEPFPEDGQPFPDGEIPPDGQPDGQAAEEGGEALDSDGRPLPQPLRESRPQSRTTGDSVSYVLNLSPQVFGLAGDSLDDYDVLTSAEHVMIDGVLCAEFQIYSRGGNANTNRIEGTYYITQEGERKLYRVDRNSGLAVEMPLPQESAPAQVQTDSAGEPEGDEEA